MNQQVLTGMVLSTAPVGEYDRRVVLLTKELGKIAAFARGARKPNSPLVGAVTPFSFGEFTVYVGKSSYTIQCARISNYFEKLRQDLTGACYGSYFLEFTACCTEEANDEREMLKLLYQTLKALSNDKIPNRLVRCIFELKALCINGQAPQVFQCVSCGNRNVQGKFSVKKGGLVCRECDKDLPDAVLLDHSTLYSMQFIVSRKIESLYTFVVSEKVLDELEKVMDSYIKEYVGRRFNSLEILQTML